jgi:hypothetical protein
MYQNVQQDHGAGRGLNCVISWIIRVANLAIWERPVKSRSIVHVQGEAFLKSMASISITVARYKSGYLPLDHIRSA